MLAMIARRGLAGVVILWAVSAVVFASTELLPGNAATAILGKSATPEAVDALEEQLHLDRPAASRYVEWLSGVLRGDLGTSLTADVPVWTLLKQRLVNSLLLATIASIILIPLSIALGTIAAVRRFGATDASISIITLGLIALPEFVAGVLLVLLFAVVWPVLPAISPMSPDDGLVAHGRELVLPVLALLATSLAYTTRMVRGSLIEALDSDYVRTARLGGVPETRVVTRHALRNGLAPSIQAFGVSIGYLFGGIVVIESVFQYPGMGQGLVNAVSARDLPTVQAIVLVIAIVYVLINLIADLVTIILTARLKTNMRP